MIIEITRKFKKQVEACKDRSIRAQVGKTLEDTIAASKPSDIKFAPFDHRSDIYKYFP